MGTRPPFRSPERLYQAPGPIFRSDKLADVKGSFRRVRACGWALAASVLFALPLVSIFGQRAIGLPFPLLVLALTCLSAASPAAGVVALSLLLPFALAIETLLAPALGSVGINESLVFAFLVGAAWRVASRRPGERDWFGRPALAMGVLVAASTVVDLVAAQVNEPARAASAGLWHHVTREYVLAERPFIEFHESVRWLADLTLAVFVERTLRRWPIRRPVVVRMWLAGAVAGASFAALRLSDVLLRNRGHVLETLKFILTSVRISALHPDVNAAGSYFAISLVVAAILAFTWRSAWIACLVLPPVLLAFALAQSRSAIAGVAIVLLAVWLRPILRARKLVRGALLSAAVLLSLLGIWRAVRTSHAGTSVALDIRVELAQVALRMTRDQPVFGVGVGRFVTVSRRYISAHAAALYAFAPAGQNAHNNFLQVMAELGLPGFFLFLWLVIPPAWPPRREDPGSPPSSALAFSAGIAAFLVSALFGHPLLIAEVAAMFFLTLGIAGGLRRAPERDMWPAVLSWTIVAAVIVSLPWRVRQQFVPDRETVGVGAPSGTLDGVSYESAASGAVWYVPVRAAGIALPVRWDAGWPDRLSTRRRLRRTRSRRVETCWRRVGVGEVSFDTRAAGHDHASARTPRARSGLSPAGRTAPAPARVTSGRPVVVLRPGRDRLSREANDDKWLRGSDLACRGARGQDRDLRRASLRREYRSRGDDVVARRQRALAAGIGGRSGRVEHAVSIVPRFEHQRLVLARENVEPSCAACAAVCGFVGKRQQVRTAHRIVRTDPLRKGDTLFLFLPIGPSPVGFGARCDRYRPP